MAYEKSLNDVNYNDKAISLDDWIKSYRDEEEMREIFLNMDRAMKYIHDHGYCVKSFDPRNIMILNNSINQIKLDTVALPDDYAEKKQYIKEDIYNSSFIQIGLYSKCLPFLKRDFLKPNFSITSKSQSLFSAFKRLVVEALVYSFFITPVRR